MLKDRFDQFTDGLVPKRSLPDPYLSPEQASYPSDFSRIFRRNWEEAEDLSFQVQSFQRVLAEALERGKERKPRCHQVVVHGDWILALTHQGHTSSACFIRRVEEQGLRNRNPILLCDLETDPLYGVAWGMAPDRIVETIKAFPGAGTGFMNVVGLRKFLSATEGFHPDDQFELHGGQFQACLSHTALQLLGLSIGKWWSYDPQVERTGVLRAQAALLACSKPFVPPVRLGLVMDGEKASLNVNGLSPEQKSILHFVDDRTEFVR